MLVHSRVHEKMSELISFLLQNTNLVSILRAVSFKYTWEGGTPLISDPSNTKKYGFTPTTNRKIKKNCVPPSQVDLNGTALSKICPNFAGHV